MSYNSKIESRGDYIRVEVSGTRTPGNVVADADDVGQQIARTCLDEGIERVLVVLRLAGRLSPLDAYDIVTHSEGYGWSRDFKLAFVDTNAESIEDSYFTETVAVNRAYRMRVFDNENDATDWLLNS